MLKIDDKIPNFEILTDKGDFKVSNHLGKNIVVFFFPKADTSGCTAESIAFTNLQKKFEHLNCIVIGISKGSDRKVGMEKIYRASDGKVLIFSSDEPALLVLQQIRDEAHRFAISGHRQQRGKVKKKSTLEKIDGLGPKRRQQLLKQFGGLREIQSAGVDDLCTVDGINKSLAQRVYDFFHDGVNG